MIFDWYEAFWLFISICIGFFLIMRYYVYKKIEKRFPYEMSHRKEFLFSISVAVKLFILIATIYLNYFMWESTNTLNIVNSQNVVDVKVGLFKSEFNLATGKKIELKDCKELIINNTNEDLIYEVIEYGSDIAIQLQHINPSFNDYRGYKAKIPAYTIYDCSKIGVHYFFKNQPPLERGSEAALPFGNRDEEINDLYGWLRTENDQLKSD